MDMMEKGEKLYLHLFTEYMERYCDSNAALKEVGFILDTPDELMWKKLREAIEQANRIRIFKENNISLTVDSIKSKLDMSDLPEDIIEQLMGNVIDLELLKSSMTTVIKKQMK